MVFIEAPAFSRHVGRYLTDDEYRRLQTTLEKRRLKWLIDLERHQRAQRGRQAGRRR